MIRDGTELDMRGRCSAGQKVIARFCHFSVPELLAFSVGRLGTKLQIDVHSYSEMKRTQVVCR